MTTLEATPIVSNYSEIIRDVTIGLLVTTEETRDILIAGIIETFWDEDQSPGDLALCGVALLDVRVRDSILWHMAQLDDELMLEAYSVLLKAADVVYENDKNSSYERGHSSPAYTCAGIAALLLGNYREARVCIDFVYASDPSYSLAMLVDMALKANINPDDCRSEIFGGDYEIYRYGG